MLNPRCVRTRRQYDTQSHALQSLSVRLLRIVAGVRESVLASARRDLRLPNDVPAHGPDAFTIAHLLLLRPCTLFVKTKVYC
jgi:hypothetical protein